MSKEITGYFTGTIDELLDHCFSIEIDEPETEELPEDLKQFMRENEMTQNQLIEFAKQEMIKQELEKLIEDGKVEVIGYTPSGDPIYKATEIE